MRSRRCSNPARGALTAVVSERPAAGDGPSQGRGFFFNVNFVFLSTVLTYGLGFIVVIVLARALGPEGRGLTALYQAGVNVGFAFFGFGIGAAIIYHVARRDLTSRQALEAGLSVTLVATALTAAALGVIALLAGDRLDSAGVPFWLALVAVPAVIQFRVVEGALRAQGRFGASNSLELLLPLTTLVGLLAIEATAGLDVARAIAAWSLSIVAPVLLGYVLVGRASWPRGLGTLASLIPALRFGLQSQAGNLVQLLNYRLDSYLVLLFVSTSGVGLYAVGVSLSEGMWFIANSVAVVLLTDLTAGDAAHAARLTPIVCRNTLAVTAAAALGGAIVAPLVIPAVFGAAFDGALAPFLWLLPGTVGLAGGKVLAAYVFSRGRPAINAWIAVATLAVNVGADLALIPAFEVSGAAIGSSLAYGVSLGLTAIAYRRLSGGRISEALLPRAADLLLYVEGLGRMKAAVRGPGRSGPAPPAGDR